MRLCSAPRAARAGTGLAAPGCSMGSAPALEHLFHKRLSEASSWEEVNGVGGVVL